MNRDPESGFAAIFQILILVLILAGTGTVMLQGSQVLHSDTTRVRGEMQAVQAAEGGLAKARHALHRDPKWLVGELSIGSCEVRVTLVRAEDGTCTITSTATALPQGAKGTPVRRVLVEVLERDGSVRGRL